MLQKVSNTTRYISSFAFCISWLGKNATDFYRSLQKAHRTYILREDWTSFLYFLHLNLPFLHFWQGERQTQLSSSASQMPKSPELGQAEARSPAPSSELTPEQQGSDCPGGRHLRSPGLHVSEQQTGRPGSPVQPPDGWAKRLAPRQTYLLISFSHEHFEDPCHWKINK